MSFSESRYLHIAGASAAGGWFTGLGPNKDVSVAIPTVAPVHLPMVGGISENKGAKIVVDTGKADFGKRDRKTLADLRSQTLMTLGSGYAKVEASSLVVGKTPQSTTIAEIKSLTVDDFSVKLARVNMAMSHPAGTPQPQITFGPTEITGLKLGKSELKITLDLASFNKYATMADFDAAFRAGKLPRALVQTLGMDDNGGLVRGPNSGYVVGSLVSKIEGKLPDGATIENGYIINWPGFGRIILGEVLMGPYLRRITLVRLKQQLKHLTATAKTAKARSLVVGDGDPDRNSDQEYSSGCSGGSYYP